MSETLPFTQTYQAAIIGWMFKDSIFYAECINRLSSSMFIDPKLAEIFRTTSDLTKTAGHHVTEADVKNALVQAHPSPTEHTARINALTMACSVSCQQVSKDVLESQMVEWIHATMTREAVFVFEKLWNKKDNAGIRKHMSETLRKLESVRFKQDERKMFSIDALEERDDNDRAGACTTGNPWFDDLLLKGSRIDPQNLADYKDLSKVTTGSLLKKDLTIIIGPSNAGKTTTVCTMMAWNLLLGRKVLYISLEEKCENIFRKMFQATSGQSLKDFSRKYNSGGTTEENQRKKQYFDKLLTDNFFMYEWFDIKDRTSEKVIAHVEKVHTEEMARTGTGFDLVVVDYPALLMCEALRGNNSQRHSEIAMIYTHFKLMAGRNGFHVLAPAQSNRSGYVAATRSGPDSRMLDLADVGGSYDLTTVGDNVITINRSNADSANNIIKFHIAKCRSAPRGTIFCSKTNFQLSRTHGPELASTTLDAGMDKVADESLAQTLGKGERNNRDGQVGLWHNALITGDYMRPQMSLPSQDVMAFTKKE